MIDHHLITDLLPTLAYLYFDERFDEKHKTVDTLVVELDVPANQLLALFNKAIRRLSEYLDQLCMDAVRQEMDGAESSSRNTLNPTMMQPLPISLDVIRL
ncbi:unnamed protein product [Gongylonema pulchrum]|uniref:tRNA_bind_2 domain-containing protein n=1 Tax=Gongylonema pulchrum TaxID=637853 RepID=A0A183DKZ4_9BILA|nr:unnamed protein product [Gongylonema pulchrum]